MIMPSSTLWGSPSSTERSMKAPGSPSSALHTMYFWSALFCRAAFHLNQVGKPAPPRPRRPETFTSSMTSSGVMEVMTFLADS